MQLKELEAICLSKQGATKEFPFGVEVAVFKVMNKIFALVGIDANPLRINLKATPDDCLAYRDIYKCVKPGYHMNKKHWNTIILDGEMPQDILEDMIDESYELVVSKLTKAQKEELNYTKH
ncbi:MAG: MmcQ/YjbR family DNA-binding protein [Thiovulaceae bacterium]|jgi:predicted DNA-binding protein (MmcQ/YjbR family)|nr:MmcQ/YjbR family DNA-binding protein [Sulfurimonadaceae bacterium]MCW9026983.1 MmcQ/YjbR family DNA-binding protein [Sulfurimonadaceae bacterium]